jgi:histidyl-tRNA synthetase
VGVVVINQKHASSSFQAIDTGLLISQKLRQQNVNVLHSNFEGGVGGQLQKLTSSCDLAIIVGEDEWKNGKITLKNLTSGQQQILTIDECLFELNK